MSSWYTKLLMTQGNAYGGYRGYGLAFQLDCTKKCTAENWVDLIGGITFTGNNTRLVDNVPYFSNPSNYYSNSQLNMPCIKRTIEVVFKPDYESLNKFAIITSNLTGDIGFIRNNSGGVGYYEGIGLNDKIENEYTPQDVSGQIRTISIAYDREYDSSSITEDKNSRAYENLVELNLNSTGHGSESAVGSDPSGTYIGNSRPITEDSAWYFIGKIYAIRIYRRALTKKEILFNQAIDLQRFGV